MNKIYVRISLATTLLLLSSLACTVHIGPLTIETSRVQGSGNVITVERQVDDFDSINLSGIGKVFIEFGEEETLRIQAEDNIIKYIETKVRGNTLIIGINGRVNLHPTKAINYYLTVKQLGSITVSGAGNIEIGELSAERFSITISGAGSIDIGNLEVDRLDVQISGVGDLSIGEGNVRFQNVDLSGGGNYNAQNLQSTETDINLSGFGSATVWVTDHLNADISGVGSVLYVGNPEIDSDISGLGSVRKIDE